MSDAAERRYKLILHAHPELLSLSEQAQHILNENSRFHIKSARLYRMADAMKAMIEPFIVCGPGCGHCCHMPTMVYQHEADVMAEAANWKAQRLKYRPMLQALDASRAYRGQPCPFLIDMRCSIYAYRPLICRLHNSLNDDPHDCLFKDGTTSKPVHSVSPDYVEMPYHHAVVKWRPREPWGTIHEFFPPQDG